MQSGNERQGGNRRAFLLVPISLYFILATAYLIFVPIGESPDEPGHLQCVEQVSRLRRLPQVDPLPSGVTWWSRGTVLSGRMCYHMPLYYVVAGVFHHVTGRLTGEALHFEFPPTDPNFVTSASLFIHDREAGYLREPRNVLVLRLLSVLSGGTLLWASYNVARTLFPDQEMVGVGAATLVAGWPQYIFMSRAISNDILATAFAAVVLVILLQRGQPKRFVYASLFTVLAILTKMNMIFVLVPLAATFVIEIIAPQKDRQHYVKAAIISGAILLLPVILIVGHPTLHTNFQQTALGFRGLHPRVTDFLYWIDVARLTFRSGWGQFGWMNILTPAWQITAWWVPLGISSVVGLQQLTRTNMPMVQGRKYVVLAIILIWLASCGASYLRINMNRFQPQFRFIFPLIPVFTSLAMGGYFGLFRLHRRQQVLSILMLAIVLFAANVWILNVAIAPKYN